MDKILLILDLDETLIHASEKALPWPADFQLFHYSIYKRPYLAEFLWGCHEHFQLAVWSSASDDYVEAVVKQIVPAGIPLAFVWGRSHCTHCMDVLESIDDHYSHYQYVKVLKKVKKRGYGLERVLIVDDTPSKAKRNYGNVIYPHEYLGQREDNELPQLLDYLIRLKDVENVRVIEKRDWRSE